MIQIDMPMPKYCGECPFASANFNNGIMSLSCMTPTGRSMYAPDLIYRKDRPAWCPLKEQEAVEPIEKNGFYYCGSCRYALMTNRQKYCSDCGKAVKWDG